ncbi:hypothetical protein Godav_013586, partial [Gossypium davidsonii]|nr:hypothetical protein [Gossypium davidsonii]
MKENEKGFTLGAFLNVKRIELLVLSLHESLALYGSVYYVGTILPITLILLGYIIPAKPARSKARKQQVCIQFTVYCYLTFKQLEPSSGRILTILVPVDPCSKGLSLGLALAQGRTPTPVTFGTHARK